MKRTTIFKQLILNVVIPVILTLIMMSGVNLFLSFRSLKNETEAKKKIMQDEIKSILELQDMALEILEDELDQRMHELSSKLAYEYLRSTENIENVDLYAIRQELEMDEEMEDIYIIHNGIIINSTFEDDIGLNLYDFGEAHKQLLLEVLELNRFVSERITIESNTKRYKKYTYQPTLDGEYIIEIGIYSKRADVITDIIKNRFNELATKQESIRDADLFVGEDHPFSLTKPQSELREDHLDTIAAVFKDEQRRTVSEKRKREWFDYDFIYMEREKTDLYKGSVMIITSDRSGEKKLLRTELLKSIVILLLMLIAIVIVLYNKTRKITDPIKRLVESVNRISGGHFNERVELIGNNEITNLSEKFNIMIEELESYYNELEQKVRERTAEIQQQKEEIEAQRDTLAEQRNMLADINEHLQKAYNEIELQKKHITDSIYYARRIQNAILPPNEYVKELIPDSFIFYKPKDIVSGDFYWIIHKEDKIMFAAVDCTGHGVPGAFMSIVGNNQLNYAVNVRGARKSSNILDALNRGVTDTLRQQRAKSSVRDGMDIALCVYDPKKKKLQFAGAYRPLYLIRNKELFQYKGDKFPIGAYVDEELQTFENNEIDVKKGDVIYIFSDGYPDQFGGEDGGKFLIKHFRNYLFEIHDKPMDEQKQLLDKKLLEWRGKLEQVDDILIIGVKF